MGATGAATLYQLAKRGARVLGIDQFEPPHVFGSSHGETRITRLATGEGSQFTPLVMRSHEIWHELGDDLMTTTGGVVMSSRRAGTVLHHASDFLGGTVAAAQAHGIEHELLDADDIGERFPQFGLKGDERAYYEPAAGFVRPEAAVQRQLELAVEHGAEIRRERFAGERLAERTVLACGPWIGTFLPGFRVYRQVLYWFEITGEPGPFTRSPVWIWEFGPGERDYMYGFPSLDGRSMKLATEQYDAECDPDTVDRTVTEAETAAMFADYVSEQFPTLGPRALHAEACLYTVTPDWSFVLDWHPEREDTFIASPCSGHGFKHSAAIGEAIAQTLLDGQSQIDLTPFRFS